MNKQTADEDQAAIAARAEALKDDGAAAPDHPDSDDHAHSGVHPVPRPDYPPSGAFDAEGHRPVLERSRKER